MHRLISAAVLSLLIGQQSVCAMDAAGLRKRAESESWHNQFAQAKRTLDEAIKLKPDFHQAYVDRAFVNENMKNYAAAIADFDKAIALDPKDVESMGSRAKLLDTQGKHEEAIAGYTQAIAVNDNLNWPYVQRSVAYTALKQYKKASDDLTTLVNRHPQEADYYEYRGDVYLKAGELQSALADYNKLIELSPKYPKGYHGRAVVYAKLDGKKTQRVLADYAQAKKLGW